MKVAKIVLDSYVDGPGKRNVVFFQGCPIRCEGCQNIHLWQGGEFAGVEMNVKDVVETLTANGNRSITISGGEPFAQPAAFLELVTMLKEQYDCEIIVYTGYTWDVLNNFVPPVVSMPQIFFSYVPIILWHIDILVDGPFISHQDDQFLTYRGSRNQRVINIPQTLLTDKVVLLDWDSPEIQITADGDAFMPIGLAPEFSEIGEVKSTRRCGETGRE